ncbi:ABC transporter family protein [Pontibacter mucosus]|uniref:ABC transporter family protein n=1 Tax=Pontibacter mucosus TaxID=1649266 RepID=A0A2T5YHV9_9BACT|nr:ABC transporter ATP-binding protein [Pontibacter mucosus]PTX18906.1 ABC transporter family protein [Pontibacter mucosus]
MTEAAIEVRNLSFGDGQTPVLEEVNVTFPANRFSVLLGRNGSGKSTLFNIMAGLQKYKQGSVKLMGKEEATCPSRIAPVCWAFCRNFINRCFAFR